MNRRFCQALCVSVAVALLSACGGSQSGIGAPALGPQNPPRRRREYIGALAAL